MTKRGMLIVVSGPSGVGKDTIVNSYFKNNPNAVPSISATTRPPREDEVDGLHYFFKDHLQFEALIDGEEMLEYARYNHNYYGTPKKFVADTLASGKHVVLVINVQGARQIKQLMPESTLIFIAPPSIACLKDRLEERGTDSKEDMKKRLEVASIELEKAKFYDYIIKNKTIHDAVALFTTIITAAECSPKHVPDLLKGVC